MRSLSFIVFAGAVLASGCSGSNSNANSGASATPLPAGTTDKRTSLPVYPGAMQSSTSDSSAGKMTSYMSNDSQETVAGWYKTTLGTAYTKTDNSSNASDPSIEFDKNVNGKLAERVYLTAMDQKTSIDVENVK